MEFKTERPTTFDKTVSKLCNQIDQLEEACEYWHNKYEELLAETHIAQKERLLDAQKGVANALRFALSVTDDEHGNLVISKEKRKELADNLKQH